jgi:hypothetical protein
MLQIWRVIFLLIIVTAVNVFENMALRRIFRPKKDEVTGEWVKLHNEKLHNLYFAKHC